MTSSNTEQVLDPQGLDPQMIDPQIDAGMIDARMIGTAEEAVEAPVPAAPESAFPRKAGRWLTKGGLSIVDQGLISGSNFLINILLARWLMPSAYGAYSYAFSAFLLLSYVYQSLLAEPQAVFAGSAYRKCLRGYLKALLGMQGLVTVFGITLLGGWAAEAYLTHQPDLAGALAGVALASPCILFFWLLRRAYYMNLAPGRAALGAFIYFALTTGGLFVAYHKHLMSPFTAYLLMAIGGLGTGLFLLTQVNKVLPPDSVTPPTAAQAWKKHWEYGRWALGVSAVTWIPYQLYYPLVGYFSGLVEVGRLRALTNLALPMEQGYMALSILFLPYAARVCREKGVSSSGPLVRNITLLFVGGAIAYWGLLIPFKGVAFRLLYGGKYAELAPLLPYLAIGSILWSAAFGPAILLRAIESPDSIFWARVVASVLSLVVGVPMTKLFGLWGVVISLILANFAAFLISLYILRRKSKSASPSSSTPTAVLA